MNEEQGLRKVRKQLGDASSNGMLINAGNVMYLGQQGRSMMLQISALKMRKY
jgi:hypothetical protein